MRWSPAIAFGPSSDLEAAMSYLWERKIPSAPNTGGKGGSLAVPFDRARRAIELLRDTPLSKRLTLVDEIRGGPKDSTSRLNLSNPSDVHWYRFGTFDRRKTSVSVVESLLDRSTLWWGLTRRGDTYVLHAPIGEIDKARKAIEAHEDCKDVSLTGEY